jgi:hypothetical protein
MEIQEPPPSSDVGPPGIWRAEILSIPERRDVAGWGALKAKTPPSDATSQYPLLLEVRIIPTTGRWSLSDRSNPRTVLTRS